VSFKKKLTVRLYWLAW